MLLLCFNLHKWAAVAVGQKSVCEQGYHRSCIRPQNSNLIEKRLVEELKNYQNQIVSHSSFCVAALFNRREQVTTAAGQNLVCELRYHGLRDGTENGNFIEKKVSRRTANSSKPHHFSPFFLRRCSVSIDMSK